MPSVDRRAEIERVWMQITILIHTLAKLLDPSIPGVFVGQSDFFAFCSQLGIRKATAGRYWNGLFRELYDYLMSKNRPLIICRQNSAMAHINDRFRNSEEIIISVLSLKRALDVLSVNCVEGFGKNAYETIEAWILSLPDPPDLATL